MPTSKSIFVFNVEYEYAYEYELFIAIGKKLFSHQPFSCFQHTSRSTMWTLWNKLSTITMWFSTQRWSEILEKQ